MDQKKYLLYGGAVIIIFAIGVAVGSLIIDTKDRVVSVSSTDTFQAGWDAAKKRLADTGYSFPVMAEMVTVTGTVQDVRAGGITMHIRPLEPLADPALDTRTVTFDANTKFYQVVQKDPIEYQKAVAAFNLKMKSNLAAPATIPGELPQPFIKTATTAQSIKTGMTVSVTAAGNIKEAKDFVATKVDLQAAPVLPVEAGI